MYPRIYLAIDNCFASKRWSTPADWMKVISDAGIYYVEASADNECDPLYSGTDFTRTGAATSGRIPRIRASGLPISTPGMEPMRLSGLRISILVCGIASSISGSKL